MNSNTKLISAYVRECNNENNHMIDLFEIVSTEGDKYCVLIGLLFMILTRNTVVFYKDDRSKKAFDLLKNANTKRIVDFTAVVKTSLLLPEQNIWDWVINNQDVLVDFFLNSAYNPPSYRASVLNDVTDRFCRQMYSSKTIIVSIDKLYFLNDFCVRYGDQNEKTRLLEFLQNKTVRVFYSDINQVTKIPDMDIYLRNLLTGKKNEIALSGMDVDSDDDSDHDDKNTQNDKNNQTTKKRTAPLETSENTRNQNTQTQQKGTFGANVALQSVNIKSNTTGSQRKFGTMRNESVSASSQQERNDEVIPETITKNTETSENMDLTETNIDNEPMEKSSIPELVEEEIDTQQGNLNEENQPLEEKADESVITEDMLRAELSPNSNVRDDIINAFSLMTSSHISVLNDDFNIKQLELAIRDETFNMLISVLSDKYTNLTEEDRTKLLQSETIGEWIAIVTASTQPKNSEVTTNQKTVDLEEEEEKPKEIKYGDFILRQYEDLEITKQTAPKEIYTKILNDFSYWVQYESEPGKSTNQMQKMFVKFFLQKIKENKDVKQNLITCVEIINNNHMDYKKNTSDENTNVVFQIGKPELDIFKKKFVEIFIVVIDQKFKNMRLKALSAKNKESIKKSIDISNLQNINALILRRISDLGKQ